MTIKNKKQAQVEQKFNCSRCGKSKVRNDFHIDRNALNSVSRLCKLCHSDYQLELRYRKIISKEGVNKLKSLMRVKLAHIQLIRQILGEYKSTDNLILILQRFDDLAVVDLESRKYRVEQVNFILNTVALRRYNESIDLDAADLIEQFSLVEGKIYYRKSKVADAFCIEIKERDGRNGYFKRD